MNAFVVVRIAVAALCATLVLAAGPALAQWRVQQGIDISSGGESVLLIGTIDERTSFYAQCVGGQRSLFISTYDARDEPLAGPGEVDIGMTLDEANATVWWTKGQQSRRPSYLTTTWSNPSVISRTLGGIMAARDTITFSIFLADSRTMADLTISAKGSTAAAREFIALCEAQSPGTVEPGEPQPVDPQPVEEPPVVQPPREAQPPQQPVGVEGGWLYVPGDNAALLSPVSSEMQLTIICAARGAGIVLLDSTNVSDFPQIRTSREGLAVIGFGDGVPLRIPVGPGKAQRGSVIVVADNPAAGETLVSRIAASDQAAMVVTVSNVVTGKQKAGTYEMAGALAAAQAFQAACF